MKQNLLSVMTCNIRFDVQEHDPNNHFTKRVYRLTETIEKWQPSILKQDYIWLSKTPGVIDSKDWDSLRVRTLNIARLELINDDQHANILVFNTHLDVTSEEARREQANIVRTTIEQWHNKYPKAVVLLFEDFFNSIPKQTSYNTLASGFLHDT
ncbi:unnamed protein product [Rotaria sp. Silwood1]|nr:unnamed protein product [Rotaria sp. Silwood1]CAF1612217.1 unnamed protein product [Rotaria sp. Silwood1]CAF3739153.1 unnamed protein product [Rotaria sp. Silwood1]CAF3750930.1 unnamed protein product [Rotaria sp. Silwood1]CAF3784040.1 unnamed protein product [Rotaria sp. Silwood1]